jgi:hypothetical protein
MDAQGYVSVEEVRQALSDVESNLLTAFLQSISDELKPVDEKGRWKPSPLLVLLFVLLFALAGVFLYFSLGERS